MNLERAWPLRGENRGRGMSLTGPGHQSFQKPLSKQCTSGSVTLAVEPGFQLLSRYCLMVGIEAFMELTLTIL